MNLHHPPLIFITIPIHYVCIYLEIMKVNEGKIFKCDILQHHAQIHLHLHQDIIDNLFKYHHELRSIFYLDYWLLGRLLVSLFLTYFYFVFSCFNEWFWPVAVYSLLSSFQSKTLWWVAFLHSSPLSKLYTSIQNALGSCVAFLHFFVYVYYHILRIFKTAHKLRIKAFSNFSKHAVASLAILECSYM